MPTPYSLKALEESAARLRTAQEEYDTLWNAALRSDDTGADIARAAGCTKQNVSYNRRRLRTNPPPTT